MICVECGAPNMRLSHEPLRGTFRGDVYTVRGLEYHICDKCQNWVMIAAMADKYAKDLAKQYIHAHNVPSGAEIKVLRKSLGLSQKEFEHFLGVSSPSVSRWETGAVIPSLPIVYLLQQLMHSEDSRKLQFDLVGCL